MLGEAALELIRETLRSQDMLEPFNEDKVRSVLDEIRALYEQNEKEIFADNPSKAAIVLRHAALERNKRCVLAFLNHRAERIRSMRWQFGAVLPPGVSAIFFSSSSLSLRANKCLSLTSLAIKVRT